MESRITEFHYGHADVISGGVAGDADPVAPVVHGAPTYRCEVMIIATY